MAEVTTEHRGLALPVWRRSNDPADSEFGPELLAQAIADAEQRGREAERAARQEPLTAEQAVMNLEQLKSDLDTIRVALNGAPDTTTTSAGRKALSRACRFVMALEADHPAPTETAPVPQYSHGADGSVVMLNHEEVVRASLAKAETALQGAPEPLDENWLATRRPSRGR